MLFNILKFISWIKFFELEKSDFVEWDILEDKNESF